MRARKGRRSHWLGKLALVAVLAAIVGAFVVIDQGVDAVAAKLGVKRVHCDAGADPTCGIRRAKAWLTPVMGGSREEQPTMEYRDAQLHFERREGPSRWEYDIEMPTGDTTQPWRGRVTRWDQGAAEPVKEVVALYPDAEDSHGQRENAVRVWKTEDGAKWTIASDKANSLALTETRDGKYVWSAGLR